MIGIARLPPPYPAFASTTFATRTRANVIKRRVRRSLERLNSSKSTPPLIRMAMSPLNMLAEAAIIDGAVRAALNKGKQRDSKMVAPPDLVAVALSEISIDQGLPG
jgi:hypothetical protein